MPTGHDGFAKKQTNTEGNLQMGVGGAYAAHSAASAPVFRTGRKKPTQMVQASPKRQAGRYQGELTQAMREGKVPQDSTLRVLKTPSGRFINAGGTHRHIARQAMGQPTKKIDVASLAFEPHNSLYEKVKQRRGIAELKRGSKAAIKGKSKPVGFEARRHNVYAADAADFNDETAWQGLKSGGGRGMASIVRRQHRAGLAGAAIGVGIGAGVAGAGALAHHVETKRLQKVGKAMDGHQGFEISKRDFSTKQRKKLASKGDALPDGSFPIKSKGDLKNAEKLEGHSKHPAEVAALIARKKAELSKAVSGHDAFLLEDVEKAFGLGGLGGAVKGMGAIAGGVAKPQLGKLRSLGGAGLGVGRGLGAVGGNMIRRKPMAAVGVAGGAGLGAGLLAGRKN